MHPVFNYLDKTWPFASAVLGGVFAFGSLHSDVTDLKAAQAIAHTDHDAITRMEQKQDDMKTDLMEIRKSLQHIEHP